MIYIKLIKLTAVILLLLTIVPIASSCSSKLPKIYSYEDFGVRFDKNTDFDTLDSKYIEQVKDQMRLAIVGVEETNDLDHEKISQEIEEIEKKCVMLMASMITEEKNPNRVSLWEGTAFLKYDNISQESAIMKDREFDMADHFENLNIMAKGYAMPGCKYYRNERLLAHIKEGLDYMFNEVYNYYLTKYNYCNSAYQKEYAGTKYAAPEGVTGTAPFGGNWFEWDIAAPLAFTETILLIENELRPDEIENYLSSFDRILFLPCGTMANRIWMARAVLVSAAVQNDEHRFWYALQQIKESFEYVDLDEIKSGNTSITTDGFYEDGSFIQHGVHPYMAGYGLAMISQLSEIILWTTGTAFELPAECVQRQIDWLFESYQPATYKGAMASCLSGRQIARNSDETIYGRAVFQALVRASTYKSASDEDKEKLLSIAKYYYDCNSEIVDYYDGTLIYLIKYTEKAMKVAKPRKDYIVTKIFPQTDRVIVHGKNYGAAVAMSSKRIAKYESINKENMSGWYTGDGALFIYSNNTGEYGVNFWKNIDWYKIPGTTVTDAHRLINNSRNYNNPSNFAGGVSVGKYGLATIEIAPFVSGVREESFSSSLSAKKSYFFFDDEIVTLGSDIDCSDKANVLTIIENRLVDTGDKYYADGRQVILKNDAVTQKEDVKTAWFTGLGGYYFPNKTTINMIQKSGTKTMFQLWIPHGYQVEDKTYECVYLPNMSQADTEKYAKAPDIQVLSNTDKVQAVKDKSSGATGYVFWEGASVGDVSADKACAVMTYAEDKKTFKVAVSDPSQSLDEVTVTVTLPSADMSIKNKSDNIDVSINGTVATITVDMSAHYGWSYEVVFKK